jgi:hypothetical protein
MLHPQEIDPKQFLNNSLVELLIEEEIKWYQRAKVKDLRHYKNLLIHDNQILS